MVYVMSDLHGCHDAFLEMLQKIGFNNGDDLYVLGDFIDRGEQPIDLLHDCMGRVNVYPLLGNHEVLMLHCVESLPAEASFETVADYYSDEDFEYYSIWMQNGGATTLTQYLALPEEQRQELIGYLHEFRLYEDFTLADGRRILMTHSGIEGFDPALSIADYPAEALLNARPQQTDRFYTDRLLIFGHTPTFTYPELHGKSEILFTDTYINIDCGAVFREVGGRLGCLRLDDMEVFYV